MHAMPTFHHRPAELTPELHAASVSLRERIVGSAREKVVGVTEWRIAYGRRSTGAVGGTPELSQWGFQVTACDVDGTPLPLTCFFEESILLENEALAERI